MKGFLWRARAHFPITAEGENSVTGSIKIRATTILAGASALVFGCTTDGMPKSEIIERSTLGEPVASSDHADRWKLVWQDEFDSPEIDREKWDFDINCWGGGNDERQCYTDRTENTSVKEGKLVITAIKENWRGFALPTHMRLTEDEKKRFKDQPFTSARLVTRGKAAWKYGRIEVRAKLPQGQGTWPAIWMLPEDNAYGTWAASGEIDIMEAVNLGVSCEKCPGGVENEIAGTLHFGGLWPENSLHSTRLYLPSVLSDFHTYGVIWEPDRMIWTVDGRVYAEKTTDDWFTTNSEEARAPFDQRFHLLLNFAVGGKWPEETGEGGVDETNFPKTFEIDWVRVWQCGDGKADAAKCTAGGASD